MYINCYARMKCQLMAQYIMKNAFPKTEDFFSWPLMTSYVGVQIDQVWVACIVLVKFPTGSVIFDWCYASALCAKWWNVSLVKDDFTFASILFSNYCLSLKCKWNNKNVTVWHIHTFSFLSYGLLLTFFDLIYIFRWKTMSLTCISYSIVLQLSAIKLCTHNITMLVIATSHKHWSKKTVYQVHLICTMLLAMYCDLLTSLCLKCTVWHPQKNLYNLNRFRLAVKRFKIP